MARPFRFTAPTLRPTAVARPRLLSVLHQRWEHRVTLVIGGAGLGKTTLLVQAMAENRLASRGHDVWLGLDPSDADGELGADLLRALGVEAPPSGRTLAQAVVAAVWRRSPTPVCLVLDDVHVLPAGSPGHDLLVELVGALPANGHVVLATRTDPLLPIARLATTGELQRVTETQLRFNDLELHELAQERGVDADELAATGGWPAMAELTLSAGRSLAGDYLWQEVIEPLGRDQRRILAAVVDLGGGDDALLSAALDEPVALATALDGVPLLAVDDAGWYQPHALWHPMARLRLPDAVRHSVIRRAIRHHVARARFDEAFTLLTTNELWEEAPTVFRASCLHLTRHPTAEQLRRWLATCPEAVAASPSGRLAVGVLAELVEPDKAADPLRAAIEGFRAEGDVDAELGAITHLGRAAWWNQDLAVLAELYDRVCTVEATGHPIAAALASVGRALFADLAGDDAAILDALGGIGPGRLGPAWDPAVDWLRAAAHYGLGDPAAVVAITTPLLERTEDPIFRVTIEALHWSAEWQQGILDTELEQLAARLNATAATGVLHNVTLGAADLSRAYSHVGALDQARTFLARARSQELDHRPVAAVRVALEEASLLVAEGNEDGATELLRGAIERFGLDRSAGRRAWRDALCLTYVLVSEARVTWDAAALGACWSHARDLAATVVALRQSPDATVVARVDVSDLDAVRARLHYRFAAELAVGLHHAGRPEGAALLRRLGHPGRSAARDLARGGEAARARAARSLLATVPAPPPVTVEIGVLGPLVLRRDGRPADEPALRRERVRALLAYLIARRNVSRADAIATLWPDFDDHAGANNLRVTISHLLRALEPWRAEGEPAYFLRTDGEQLLLVRDPQLRIDVDEFDRHLAAADAAERDGAPSLALDAYLSATELWRGDLHRDGPDFDWLDLDRERVRTRYIAALQRAAQLLVGRGDLEHADDLARTAIQLDPWAEAAHGVRIAAALGRGDRSGARRALERCLAATADLGVEPSEDTQRLARRIKTGR